MAQKSITVSFRHGVVYRVGFLILTKPMVLLPKLAIIGDKTIVLFDFF